jgi:hypothetical protein
MSVPCSAARAADGKWRFGCSRQFYRSRPLPPQRQLALDRLRQPTPNGRDAPIADLPALAAERGGSTLLGHSASHSERLFLPQSGHSPGPPEVEQIGGTRPLRLSKKRPTSAGFSLSFRPTQPTPLGGCRLHRNLWAQKKRPCAVDGFKRIRRRWCTARHPCPQTSAVGPPGF